MFYFVFLLFIINGDHDILSSIVKHLCNLYLVTNDSKLKKFQYKLLHRALPTNTFLVKIGIKNSDLCNFCKNASDSILHYIWLCPVVTVLESDKNLVRRNF